MTPRFVLMLAIAALAGWGASASAAAFPADTTVILSGAPSLLSALSTPVADSFDGPESTDRTGHFVAFASRSDGLSSEDDDGVQNVYVRDMVTGNVTLASRRSGVAGAPATADCGEPAISDNARRVAFTCDGPLDAADANGKKDVYVRDLTTQTTLLASRRSGGGAIGNSDSGDPTLSADGSRVAFASLSTNLGADFPAPTEEIYLSSLPLPGQGGTNTTSLVSVAKDGGLPNSSSEQPSISDDGAHVAFSSFATNLVDGDNNAGGDVFVRTLGASSQTVLASRATGNGALGNGFSDEPVISGDGTAVAFRSTSATLVPGLDSKFDEDVYRRALTGAQETTLVDVANGHKADKGADQPAINRDGTLIAFRSKATDLDPPAAVVQTGVYVAANGGSAKLVSRSAAPSNTPAIVAEQPSLSGDGEHVVFETVGSLTGDDIPGVRSVAMRDLPTSGTRAVSRPGGGSFSNEGGNSFGGSITPDGRFVAFETSAPAFGVPPGAPSAVVVRDTLTGTTVVASRQDGPNGVPMTGSLGAPSISADGRRVAFLADTDGRRNDQVWVRDLSSGRTILASRGDGLNGAPADDFSSAPSLDAAGDRVAFTTEATNLPGSGQNPGGLTQVYVRDLNAATTVVASVGADGKPPQNGAFGGALSANGARVAFETGSRLLPEDTNNNFDVYARDLAAKTTRLVSVSGGGGPADGDSGNPSISADGTRIAFDSLASNLGAAVPERTEQIWVRDLVARTTTLASRADGAAGQPGNAGSSFPLLSGDGNVVAFGSSATNLFSGPVAQFGETYRRDLAVGTTRLVSRGPGPDGAASRLDPSLDSMTANGACVVFDAPGDLLGPVAGGADTFQVYMRAFAADCGRPAPPAALRDTTPPVLRLVSLSRKRFRVAKGRTAISAAAARKRRPGRGTVLRFTASEAGRLKLVIQRPGPGRRAGKGKGRTCKPVRHRVRRGRCTAYRHAATLTRSITAGRGEIKLTGRIGRRRMRAGGYRLVLTARDSAGNASQPVRRTFTIVKG